MLSNKVILITGATGSFGSNFVKKILLEYPQVKKIIIYSRDEYKQFKMAHNQDFESHLSKLKFVLGDVRDKDQLKRACDGVDICVHAAAIKHVPVCEQNPFEAIKTNIYGAQNIIDCAIECGIQKVIAISTDKACAPVNLYGATKLCSDKLFISANASCSNKNTRFAVVRFGNLAGSRGSVIPFFKKLVKQGVSSLPITDRNMTRFWLTVEEASELVLQAIKTMQGGELYIKKSPSFKIEDLAKVIAPHIPLQEVGLRPGEKIHEQMITKEDALNTFEFDNYYVVLPQTKWEHIEYDYPHAKKVPAGFEYHSGNNTQWLSADEMKRIIQEN